MRTRARAVIAGAAALCAATALAAPAQAYDVELYEYAAGHMLQTSDVPKGLGAFGTNMNFSGQSSRPRYLVCSVKDANVTIPGGKAGFNANFSTGAEDSNTLDQQVTVYASAEGAIKAFNTVKKAMKKCPGTQSGSWTDDQGVTYTYSSTTTIGTVPSVAVTGVESLFVNTNYIDGSSDRSSKDLRDSYNVLTLLNNVIISTYYQRMDDANVSTPLRKKVNQAAFNAVTRWAE